MLFLQTCNVVHAEPRWESPLKVFATQKHQVPSRLRQSVTGDTGIFPVGRLRPVFRYY